MVSVNLSFKYSSIAHHFGEKKGCTPANHRNNFICHHHNITKNTRLLVAEVCLSVFSFDDTELLGIRAQTKIGIEIRNAWTSLGAAKKKSVTHITEVFRGKKMFCK